jgi:hypothetical protein
MVACNGTCIDPSSNDNYCGASGDCTGANAGSACGSGEVCSGSACVVTCPGDEIACNGQCIDPNRDNTYCGATADCQGANAGSACGSGSVCDGSGACALTCQSGLTDCNGTCTDTDFDPNNCGMCGSACAVEQACSAGACTALFATTFVGPQTNIPIDTLQGWSQCFVEDYNTAGTSIDGVLAACSGSELMMACRPTGSDTLQLAAYAARADVTFETGQSSTPHDANGVGWYFDEDFAWGFAPEGAPIELSVCDTYDINNGTDASTPLRLCWHTVGADLGYGSDTFYGGFRCGADTDLNDSSSFERVIYQANF